MNDQDEQFIQNALNQLILSQHAGHNCEYGLLHTSLQGILKRAILFGRADCVQGPQEAQPLHNVLDPGELQPDD